MSNSDKLMFELDASVMEAMVEAIKPLCDKGMPLPEICSDTFTWKDGDTVHIVLLPRLYASANPRMFKKAAPLKPPPA